MLPENQELIRGRDILAHFNTRWEEVLIVAWNKLYKKKIFNKLRFVEGVYHEDEYSIVDILNAADNVCCIQKPLYHYVLSDNSIMRNCKESVNEKKTMDYINMCFLRAEKFRELGYEEQEYISIIEYIGALLDKYHVLCKTRNNKDFMKIQRSRMKQIRKDQRFRKKSTFKNRVLVMAIIICPRFVSRLKTRYKG